MGANAASFAIEEINFIKPVLQLLDTTLGAINEAKSAFVALGIIMDRPL
jgi:hypothetical protein